MVTTQATACQNKQEKGELVWALNTAMNHDSCDYISDTLQTHGWFTDEWLTKSLLIKV